MQSAFVRWLRAPWAPLASVGLALLLASPALTTGFVGDDYFHKLVLTGNREIPTIPEDPLRMFVWADGDAVLTRAVMEAGLSGWWTNPDLVMAFFRPITVATHWLDYRLWPDSAWLMHLHSLLWYGVALLLLSRFYRRVFTPRAALAAALALLIYAVDDSHAMTLAWIANRNAILAFALGCATLLLHDRYARDGDVRAGIAAPCVLAAALLAGEAALAVAGYLAAYALFVDRLPRPRALLRLWPYVAVIGLWSLFYRTAGYGARGSGLVIDPGAEPLRYLTTALERVPVLLAAQIGIPPSDGWEAYPMVAPWLQDAMRVWVVLLVLLFALALRRKLRMDPIARFFALGMLLSALPVAAQFPHDRLLLFIGLGAAALVALLIADLLAREPGTAPGAFERGAAWTCVGLHLVLAPALLPMRVYAPLHGEQMVARADRSLDQSPSVRNKTLVLMNPPVDAYAGFVPTARSAQGRPVPGGLRWLATGASDVAVTRVDDRTLRVRPTAGFLALPSERMQRDPRDRMEVGYRVQYKDLAIEVTALTPDGRPAEILAHFIHPLEDPSYLFYQWKDQAFTPFTPPAKGVTVTLPRVDFLSLLR